MKDHKPLVGVSQCLLGDAVRYDGKSKTNPIILNKLSKIFEFVPICPEVEAGLSVPRPPVQLTHSIDHPKLTGRDDTSLDVTETMQHYCITKPTELKHLSGFIFKSRSPSCGLNSTSVYIDGTCVIETSRGVFARSMCETYPNLAVIEESELEDPCRLKDFIENVTSHN